MNATLRKSTKEVVNTLGDVLYKDESKPRIPEKDWVDLVRRVGRGDTAAMGRLYMWAHGMVFALAMRIAQDRIAAEGITVEVFQEVWGRAREFDGANSTVVAWIMNLARAQALRAREAAKQ
jgi:RNA polymerase sigma-70 factor (ECF subfamily)